MPTYEFKCQAVLEEEKPCDHEWEEFLSITAPDPEECPKCHSKGKILRLISGGSGRGTVELYGQELVDKLKADANKIKGEAAKNEKVYANLLGEDRYQQLQTQMDQRKRDRR
jgi:putative FmdB family regulatory protein